MSYFEYEGPIVNLNSNSTSDKGFQLFYKRHFRIKIVDVEGFSNGDIEIPLYHDGPNIEKNQAMKACTYNIENGKIVKTKLKKVMLLLKKAVNIGKPANLHCQI